MPDLTPPHGTLARTPEFYPVYGLEFVGENSSPSLVDIDGDGDLDAFIGILTGETQFLLNTGSATSAVFAAPVTNPFGLPTSGWVANPSFADIDGDGDLDAFIGNFAGTTLVSLNTGSATSPAFGAAVNNPYGLTDVGDHANPTFGDIDGDGDLDGFIGDSQGNTFFYLNTGSATNPVFAAPEANPFGLTDVGFLANPTLVDIDQDGDLDAFISDYYGDTALLLNTGSATSPVFSAPVTNPYGLGNAGFYASPAFADIDGDGDLDCVMGNMAGETVVYLNYGGFVVPIASSTANGTYGIGSVITLTLSFSESVIVSGGVPTLSLETGATDRVATYSGGSGTSTLTFTYTVQAGDTSADLDIFNSPQALELNGATIQDAAGNVADIVLPAPGETGSLGASAALVINGVGGVINGTPGPDTLGGPGADTMAGGNGNDRYDVNSAGDLVVETEALPIGGVDTVYSTLAAYTLTANVERGAINTGAAANLTGNGLANILYAGAGNNVLDGAGGVDLVSYASASAGVNVNLALGGAQNTGGSGSDTFISIEGVFGSAYNDSLTGDTGANNLQGAAGADTLDGGLGADTMTGGDGSDRYYVDNAGDRVVETEPLSKGGADTVYSTLAAYTLTANVERGVVHTSAAANLTGNALANILTAGAGNNVLDGAGGIDLVTYASASSGVTISLASSGAQSTGGSGSDTLLSIENLIGSAFNDRLTGNTGANNLQGGTAAGVDTLDGGLGADTMTGGDGNDQYYVDDAGDLVVELTGGGTDHVYSSLSAYTLADHVERGTITASAAANLTGNGLANILYAGAGDNVLDGSGGTDLLSYASASAGVTISLAASGAQATGGSGSDTLVSIENLYGSAYADRLTGDAAANNLQGGGGADTLDGGLGADTMTGGSGNDRYYVRDAGDMVVELTGDGTDTVYTSLAAYTLTANVERGIIDTSAAAELTGNALANSLTGGAGADTLAGLGGNDTLAGGSGADTFVFGNASGQDVINAFSFSDGDQIRLLANLNGSGIVDGATALARLTDVAGNAVLDLDGGHKLTLIGVLSADFSASDFLFY